MDQMGPNQEVTCLRFEPHTSAIEQQVGHAQRMNFKDNERGCWAKLGFIGGSYARQGRYNDVSIAIFSRAHSTL